MALYQDGILISGANTLPKMTLAEYNALPADQRPTYWERLDADYDDVLAEKTDIAPKESGTTASRAYSVGELVYVNDTLYRVKTAITSGATFTVGTNIEATNISTQNKGIEEFITNLDSHDVKFFDLNKGYSTYFFAAIGVPANITQANTPIKVAELDVSAITSQGYTVRAIIPTPNANVAIIMSAFGGSDIYAYSLGYTGSFTFNALIIASK